MWPSRTGIGAQIGYGVPGNGIIDTENGRLSPRLRFPGHSYSHDETRTDTAWPIGAFSGLKTVKGSFSTILEPQTSGFDLNSSIYNSLQSDSLDSLYVPKDVLKSYLIESGSLTSSIAYNPCVGSRFCQFGLRPKNSTLRVPAIAYVSREIGSILNLAKMRLSCHNDGEIIHTASPEFGDPYQLTFPEAIQQIAASAAFLLVRTNSTIYLLHPFQSPLHHSGIHLELVGRVHSAELHQEAFSDACFNPWVSTQVAVVDINGHFGVWHFSPNGTDDPKKLKLPESESCIDNLQELSHWKKVCFCASKSLLVFSRSSLTQCTLDQPAKSSRLVNSNTWSSILDYQQVGEELYSFMLTSKELIWFSNDGSLTKLVSYKHFLDDRDPSWKLSVCATAASNFFCVVYSQKSPLFFVYTLGFDDGMPASLHQPYYIRSLNSHRHEAHDNVLQLHLFCVPGSNSQLFGLFELHTDFGLYVRYLSITKNVQLGDSPSTFQIWSRSSTPVDTGKSCKPISKKVWKNLLSNSSPQGSAELDTAAIQSFALKIGNWALSFDEGAIQKEMQGYVSLLDVSREPPTQVTDLAEVDSMVDQLGEYLTLQNLEVLREKTLQKVYQDLEEYYGMGEMRAMNSPSSLLRTALEVGGSLVKLKHGRTNQIYEEIFKEALSGSHNDAKSILDDWDKDVVVADVTTQPDQVASQMMPTIKVSSQPLATLPLAEGTQLHTHPSQRSQPHSQRRLKLSQGSQKTQRKRRKGGFA